MQTDTRRSTRWIDSMTSLTLPLEDRRAFVRSFWATLSVGVAAPWVWLGVSLQMPVLAASGGMAAVLIALMPVMHAGFAWRVYAAWNRRLVHPFARVASRCVLGVCFAVIALAARAGRSRMSLGRDTEAATLWTTRRSLDSSEYHHVFVTKASHTGRWTADYAGWAWRTGNLWALSLIPCLIMLRFLPLNDERPDQADIYTLF